MTGLIKTQASNTAKKAYIEGLRRYKEGNFSDAFLLFSKAITEGIDDLDILYYRGMCCIESGDYKKATTDFEVLVRHFPDNAEYLFRMGYIRYKTGDLTGAIDNFTRIPIESMDFSIRWHYLSLIYYRTGNFNAAMDAIERSLSIYPTIPKIWFNAGVIMSAFDLSDRAEIGIFNGCAARTKTYLCS